MFILVYSMRCYTHTRLWKILWYLAQSIKSELRLNTRVNKEDRFKSFKHWNVSEMSCVKGSELDIKSFVSDIVLCIRAQCPTVYRKVLNMQKKTNEKERRADVEIQEEREIVKCWRVCVGLAYHRRKGCSRRKTLPLSWRPHSGRFHCRICLGFRCKGHRQWWRRGMAHHHPLSPSSPVLAWNENSRAPVRSHGYDKDSNTERRRKWQMMWNFGTFWLILSCVWHC